MRAKIVALTVAVASVAGAGAGGASREPTPRRFDQVSKQYRRFSCPQSPVP